MREKNHLTTYTKSLVLLSGIAKNEFYGGCKRTFSFEFMLFLVINHSCIKISIVIEYRQILSVICALYYLL